MVTEVEKSDTDRWIALLGAARAGDPLALESLWGQARLRLRDYAERHLSKDLSAKVDASDIVQQSLLEARFDLDKFRGTTTAELRSWLFAMVRHNIVDAGRKYRQSQCRTVRVEEPLEHWKAAEFYDDNPTPSTRMAIQEADAAMELAINNLSPRYRSILELRHRDGLGFPEIAVTLQITPAAARQMWVRAVDTLRARLTTADDRPRCQSAVP